MEVKVNEIIKTTKRLCDLCKIRETSKKCLGCGIDICPDCGVWWSTDPWTGIDCGDYWDLVCPDCNEKAQSFIKEAARISMESGERIDELERQRWSVRNTTLITMTIQRTPSGAGDRLWGCGFPHLNIGTKRE